MGARPFPLVASWWGLEPTPGRELELERYADFWIEISRVFVWSLPEGLHG